MVSLASSRVRQGECVHQGEGKPLPRRTGILVLHPLRFAKAKRPSPRRTSYQTFGIPSGSLRQRSLRRGEPLQLFTFGPLRQGEGSFAKAKAASPRLRGPMLGHFKAKHTFFFHFTVFSWLSLSKNSVLQVKFFNPSSSMALKKTVPKKRKRIGSSSRAPCLFLTTPEVYHMGGEEAEP